MMAHVLSDSPAAAEAIAAQEEAGIAALEIHHAVLAIQGSYEDWLRERAFRAPDPAAEPVDRKKEHALQQTLLSQEAMPILQVIWKESKFISQSQLKRLGFARVFGPARPLSCWALAHLVQHEDNSFGKTLAHVRRVIDAGCHYGLIERHKLAPNCAPIHGTALLHDMMMELALRDYEILRERVGWPDREGR